MSSSYSSIIVVHSVGGEQMSQTNEENQSSTSTTDSPDGLAEHFLDL